MRAKIILKSTKRQCGVETVERIVDFECRRAANEKTKAQRLYLLHDLSPMDWPQHSQRENAPRTLSNRFPIELTLDLRRVIGRARAPNLSRAHARLRWLQNHGRTGRKCVPVRNGR